MTKKMIHFKLKLTLFFVNTVLPTIPRSLVALMHNITALFWSKKKSAILYKLFFVKFVYTMYFIFLQYLAFIFFFKKSNLFTKNFNFQPVCFIWIKISYYCEFLDNLQFFYNSWLLFWGFLISFKFYANFLSLHLQTHFI